MGCGCKKSKVNKPVVVQTSKTVVKKPQVTITTTKK